MALYVNAHQSRDQESDSYQNQLGDLIERCFAQGIHDPAAIAQALNKAAIPCPLGPTWTAETFCQEMARLGR